MSEIRKGFPASDPKRVKDMKVFASVLAPRIAPSRVHLARLPLSEDEE